MRCNSCKTKIKSNQKFCPECGAEITPKKTLSKKAQAFIACVCCLVLIISGTIGGVYFYYSNNTNNNSDSNYIALAPGFTDVKITDEKSALKAINTVANVIGIENVEEELKISSTNTIDGDTYYRFQQYYNDIPVYGNSLVISADKDGNSTALTSNYTNPSNKDIIDISNGEKLENVEDRVEKYLKENIVQLSTFKEIYFQQDHKLILSYEVIATTIENIYRIIIDAADKEILSSESILASSSAEVQSEDGEVKAIGWKNDDGSYHLYNEENKISIFDFSEIEEKPTLADFSGYGVDTIYSKNNLFDKKGVCLLSYLSRFSEYFSELGDPGFHQIHSAINVNIDSNASGGGLYIENNGSLDRFGILSVGKNRNINDIDIIAHEYTHMVTNSLVGWHNSKQASAINEGISDIFGEIIESRIKGGCDWKHDERNIADPENKKDKQKYPASIEYLENAKKDGDNYFISGNSLLGGKTEDYSHYASTIISHSAYLMNIGINESNDKKISMDLLGKLWYKSIYLMQSNAAFSQCRNAVELSARIMLKNRELTQEQYNCVQEAFDAVGIENASYSYKYRVKNEFDLKVINDQNTDDVNYTLKIYKMHEDNFDFINFFLIKDRNEEIVLDENSLYGTKKLSLSDGIYKLEITDLDDSNINSNPIITKIIVDGNNEKAVNEVTIYTDFSDITTIILNDNNQSEKKETTTQAIEESTTESEPIETTENNDVSDNLSAEQLRKNIIGSWGALGSIVPEYNFIDSENCSGEYPWQSSGTYSISDNKTLTISWDGKSESEIYIWSSDTWDEFYSHYEHDVNFWYMTDDDILMLNGKEKYREGVDNFTYNSDGDLMSIISGTWISDKGYKEYQINSDGTWIESTVVVSGATVVNRTQLDNGKVEIIDDTTAKLWQEVESLSQIPGASELIYDSKNDTISVGGTNNTFTRAEYE